MNKFESILFDYGRYVFVSVFRKAQEEERYEDCAVMRDIMQKYHIPCDTSLEDWRTDLWRFGYSGDVAINNLSVYMGGLNPCRVFKFIDCTWRRESIGSC